MNNQKRNLLLRKMLFVFVLSLTSSAFISADAQVADQKPPVKRKFKYSGKIEESYDASKNITTVFFQLLPIKALEDPKGMNEVQFSYERLEFSAYFFYQGKTLTAPKEVGIGFLAQSEKPQKYLDYDLTLKADGKTLSVGKMNFQARGTLSLPGIRYYNIKLEAAISYDQFLTIANAKKVKARIGTVEFNFEKEQLEAIRDLASHTLP